MTREGSTGWVHQSTNALRRSLRCSAAEPRRPTESRVSAPMCAARRTFRPKSPDSNQSCKRCAYLSIEAQRSRGRSGTKRTVGISFKSPVAPSCEVPQTAKWSQSLELQDLRPLRNFAVCATWQLSFHNLLPEFQRPFGYRII